MQIEMLNDGETELVWLLLKKTSFLLFLHNDVQGRSIRNAWQVALLGRTLLGAEQAAISTEILRLKDALQRQEDATRGHPDCFNCEWYKVQVFGEYLALYSQAEKHTKNANHVFGWKKIDTKTFDSKNNTFWI